MLAGTINVKDQVWEKGNVSVVFKSYLYNLQWVKRGSACTSECILQNISPSDDHIKSLVLLYISSQFPHNI